MVLSKSGVELTKVSHIHSTAADHLNLGDETSVHMLCPWKILECWLQIEGLAQEVWSDNFGRDLVYLTHKITCMKHVSLLKCILFLPGIRGWNNKMSHQITVTTLSEFWCPQEMSSWQRCLENDSPTGAVLCSCGYFSSRLNWSPVVFIDKFLFQVLVTRTCLSSLFYESRDCPLLSQCLIARWSISVAPH
jgi:hypothetical protein